MATKLTKKTLTEATVNDIANQIDAEPVSSKGDIEDALDEALETALIEHDTGGTAWTNVLLVGEPGTGKTARVWAWAKEHGINLVAIRAMDLDESDLGGIPAKTADGKRVIRLPNAEFDDKLGVENTVLFLDEYNRARPSVRGSLLTLVNDHTISDSTAKGNAKKFDNLLFTVAAINPYGAGEDVDPLDRAARTRFRKVEVVPDKNNLKNYLAKEFQRKIDSINGQNIPEERKKKVLLRIEGQKALADRLLGSKDFKFDDAADIEKNEQDGIDEILNNRTFTNLLNGCNGTKADLLAKWNQFVNPRKKDMAEMILNDYVDIQDKANDALKQDSESPVFKKAKVSALDRLNSYKNKL